MDVDFFFGLVRVKKLCCVCGCMCVGYVWYMKCGEDGYWYCVCFEVFNLLDVDDIVGLMMSGDDVCGEEMFDGYVMSLMVGFGCRWMM